MKTTKTGILCLSFCLLAIALLALTLVAQLCFAATGQEDVPQSLYYGRNQLLVDDNLLGAYDAICNGVAKKESQIDLETYNLSAKDFSKVLELYRFDHPEHYWLPNDMVRVKNGDDVIVALRFGDSTPYLDGFDDDAFAR